MVAGMIDARSDLEQDTLEMAKIIVNETPEIGPEALRNAIARRVSKKYEVGPNIKGYFAAQDMDDALVNAEAEKRRMAPDPVQYQGMDDAQYEQQVSAEADKMRMAMADGPAAYQAYMEAFSDPSNTRFSAAFQRDVQASVGAVGAADETVAEAILETVPKAEDDVDVLPVPPQY
jgi:hypothetical protein